MRPNYNIGYTAIGPFRYAEMYSGRGIQYTSQLTSMEQPIDAGHTDTAPPQTDTRQNGGGETGREDYR